MTFAPRHARQARSLKGEEFSPLPPSIGQRTEASGMPCPKCAEWNLKVIDSRPAKIGAAHAIKRRRCCGSCNYRFSTFEVCEEQIKTTRAAPFERRDEILAAIRELLWPSA